MVTLAVRKSSPKIRPYGRSLFVFQLPRDPGWMGSSFFPALRKIFILKLTLPILESSYFKTITYILIYLILYIHS